MLRKTLLVILVVFVLVSIVRSPGVSADYVRQGVGMLALGVQQIFVFFDGLMTG
jgi:hypothetical protein